MWPCVWLSLAIVSLWITPHVSRGHMRTALPAAWLALASVHAGADGTISPVALPSILAFGVLCYGFYGPLAPRRTPRGGPGGRIRPSPAVRALAGLAVTGFALALMAHVVPGFFNVLVVKDALVSADGVPFTLYLNFDKALVGLFVLGFGVPLAASRAEWADLITGALPRLLLVLAVVTACALALGHVRFDPKWPAVLPFFVWANLLFTCTAEEALFRGIIQRELQGETRSDRVRALAGLVVASVLFGVAHFAGGPSLVVLSALAGLGYGWIFWRTNRIEASILTHFLVNLTHILLFTYPALA